MPSGKTHDAVSLTTAPLIAYGSYIVTKDPKTVFIGTAVYLFSALMFSGDLDIKSVQSKRWGIFNFIWIPYRKIINHRSVISHGYILSPIIRILYVYLWIFIFAFFYTFIVDGIIMDAVMFFNKTISYILEHVDFFKIVACYIFIGSFSHSITDNIVSLFKKLSR